MTLVKLGCFFGLLALTCGQILFWRRRDNVLGYIQGALFIATYMIPLFGTELLDLHATRTVSLYLKLVLLGAALYMVGLAFGAPLGQRSGRRTPITFASPIKGRLLDIIISRGRLLAIGGGFILGSAYLLMGYAPLLAGDPHAAKFGIGPYAAGLERAAVIYRLGLAVASTALPVVIALFIRNRRPFDLALTVGLLVGLTLSLSRSLAFSGVLVAGAAYAVERRAKPVIVLAVISFAFVFAAFSNEILFRGELAADSSIPKRLAASAPDLYEHLNFLRAFELSGEQNQGWALIAGGLKVGDGYYDPSSFALRTTYGEDPDTLPSGGLRLPAPIWGYVSFGFLGASVWSFLAGFFAGWGTVRIRRLLDGLLGKPGASLNMVLGAIYFTGTFGVLATFYFATSAKVVAFALALYLGRVLGASLKERSKQPVTRNPAPARLHSG